MNLIKKIPIPVSGLILALLSLGNLLNDINPILKIACGLAGSIFLALIVLKLILYPDDIKSDFGNPVIASSSGTFSMSLMILSTYLVGFMPSIGYGIWILGIALHILLIIYFTYRFIMHDFDISNVYPTYWIVYVGITMGAITAHVHGLEEIGFMFFIFGFIMMIITVPLMIYRYYNYADIPDMNKPLICISTAIFSILIVGYINSAQNVSISFLTALYIIACLCYVFALYKLVEYRILKFYPSFSAFTFPFVISALATKGVMNFISNPILSYILPLETAITTIIVAYVLVRYVNFLKID